MLPFKLVYSEQYFLPLDEHIFRGDKYRQVRERLLERRLADPNDFLAPTPATDDDLLLVHSPQYINKLLEGALSPREELLLELPYSPQLFEAFRLHAGGSMLAAERALQDGLCINLGGGFHHAFPEHGEGFCMIHDFAIAIKALQKRGRVRRVMTVDLDVHQGNGTAVIFGNVSPKRAPAAPLAGSFTPPPAGSLRPNSGKEVFTISFHQENNYPYVKPPSTLDVGLRDGCSDAEYLAWLDNALASSLQQFTPDLICYVAGADPFREDQLGGLDLTMEGLQQRDEMVFRAARSRNIPVMVILAGGYALHFEDTVTIHCNTVLAAAEVCRAPAPKMT
ncbi:MAG TPA: histone deacetylase [Terriglobales bacterium]|nr:histone deacetylase [Terriglobales bacterium]